MKKLIIVALLATLLTSCGEVSGIKYSLDYWVVNALGFSLPFSWYMCFQMYKDLKKKDGIIEMQKKIIDKLQ